MRFRLLISSARITLALAIMAVMFLGEPDPLVQRAMGWLAAPGEPPGTSGLLAMTATPSADAGLASEGSPHTVVDPSRPAATKAPTWIMAPAIQLDAPVLEISWKPAVVNGVQVTEWQVPDNAAGFHRGSAYPGNPGNTVISGHHNISAEVFRYLIDLQIGDEIILYVEDIPYHYRVAQKEIVRELGASEGQRRENARWIGKTSDERLTLVTCWPYSGNSHRLIIVARPVPGGSSAP